ncbi:MAG: sn-glycerol-3-phosphate-binding periplasmic protein UgpB [bacterium]|nr:sn-glycerol-3-phosphate-binding periplasmic protein UgpB [bacterium]
MRSPITPLVGLVLACSLMFGCGQKKDRAAAKVTITFWHSFVSSTVPALNELLKKFEQEHPNLAVKAQYIPSGDALIQKLITAIQSQTAPDVSWIHADYLQNLVQANAIYQMDEFLHGPNGLAAEELNDFYPALLEAASWRGTLYSMPMEATNLGLLYNRGLFRNAGLDPDRPPQNWQELREYARKLTFDKNGDGKLDQVGFGIPIFPASGPLGNWMAWQWLPFLWQAGGYNINLEQTEVLFNSAAGVQALTLWKEIYHELNLISFTPDYDAAFPGQQLAMMLDGPWNLPRYRGFRHIDWAIAPLPAGPAKRATIVGGEYLAIFKQSQHPQEAWTFVKWILKPETQAEWSMKSGYLPVRHAATKIKAYQDFLQANPGLKVYVDQLDFGQSPRPVDFHGLEITRLMAEAIEKATLGKQDPKTVLDEAAAKANQLLQQAAQAARK